MILIPLAVDVSLRDSFRQPKALAFTAMSVLLLAGLAIGGITGRLRSDDLPRYWRLLVAIPAWAALSAAVSGRGTAATPVVLMIAGGSAFVAVTAMAARSRSTRMLLVMVVPVLVNFVLYALQESRIWNPLIDTDRFEKFLAASGRPVEPEMHALSVGLLGNPTDVAGFLLVPALIVLVFAMLSTTVRARVGWTTAFAGLFAAIVSTRILSAAAAMFAAMLCVLLLRGSQRSGRLLLAGCVVAVLALGAYTPIRVKALSAVSDAANLRFERIATGRMPAFVAAWDMFSDHFISGVGAGGFAYEYFEYSLRAQERHPWLLDSPSRGVNFGQVHNDHLQTLAELGFPGYALFLCALYVLALPSFRPAGNGDVRARFTRLISLPLAAMLAIFATAQFPLELPAVVLGFLLLAGLSLAWRHDADRA